MKNLIIVMERIKLDTYQEAYNFIMMSDRLENLRVSTYLFLFTLFFNFFVSTIFVMGQAFFNETGLL